MNSAQGQLVSASGFTAQARDTGAGFWASKKTAPPAGKHSALVTFPRSPVYHETTEKGPGKGTHSSKHKLKRSVGRGAEDLCRGKGYNS